MHGNDVDVEDGQVGLAGLGGLGVEVVAPDGVLAADASVGDDVVEAAGWGVADGVFEKGELRGPGCYVCLGVGAVVP